MMSSLRYADKVVIITGGSSGIGKGCAHVFLRAGAKVVICCNDEKEGTAVAEDLRQTARAPAAADISFVYCDVRSAPDLRRLVEATLARHGRLDCLINNAGWHPPHKPIDDFSVADFRELLELNLVSVFAACQLALPHLRRTRGNIINMSSLVGRIGQLHATTYVATKGAGECMRGRGGCQRRAGCRCGAVGCGPLSGDRDGTHRSHALTLPS